MRGMDMFSALAEPTRRSILEFLAKKGQLSATQIYDYIHNQFPISAPAISQHLKVLRDAKLVDMEKRAQQRIYTLNPAGIVELEGWVKKMTRYWDNRFDVLDAILEKEKKKMVKKARSMKSNVKK